MGRVVPPPATILVSTVLVTQVSTHFITRSGRPHREEDVPHFGNVGTCRKTSRRQADTLEIRLNKEHE
jgi:hypothetical protein